MVTTDSEAVAITGHLPNSNLRMSGLHAGSDSGTTTVNRIEAIGREVVRHTAGATDTGNNGNLMRWDANLSHSFLKGSCDSMVAATRAKTNVLIRFKFCSFHN